MPEFIVDGIDYVIDSSGTTVGRGMDADVPISSQGLSRVHARFTIEQDGIYIEDLDSKNGTFVNGKRISAKTRLSPRDQLKIADTPCKVRFPDNYSSGAVKAKSGGNRKVASGANRKVASGANRKIGSGANTRVQSGEPSFFRDVIAKAVIPATAVLAIGLIFVVFQNLNPEGKAEAQTILIEAETALEWMKASDDAEVNRDFLKKLSKIRDDLFTIPENLTDEYVTASDLIEKIDTFGLSLDKKEMELPTEENGMFRYDSLMTQYRDGILSRDEAVTKLRTLSAVFPGTEAGIKAAQSADQLLNERIESEQRTYSEAVAQIKQHLSSKNYKEAIQTVKQAVNVKYVTLSADKITQLKNMETEIQKTAEADLASRLEIILKRLSGGNYAEMKKDIEKEYSAVGLDNLSKLRDEALKKISDQEQQDTAREKEDIQERLKACENLEKNRMYKTALLKYNEIIPDIKFQKIANDAVKKKELCELHAMGKAFIMAFVNEKKNVEIPVLGTAVAMKEDEISVDFEGATMTVPWDRLSASDMVFLMEKALEGKPFKKMYAPYSILLEDAGKNDKAKEFREKALEALPTLKKKFPNVF